MIFEEQISRKPNHYPWTNLFIKAMHDGFWTDSEFKFHSDIHDFKTVLSEQQKETTIRSLSAIGQIETKVKKFWAKLGDNLPHPSIIDLGYVMANTEVIHNDAYDRLLKELGMEEVFEKNLELDIIKNRTNYLNKFTHKFHKDNKRQYVYSLILFTLFVENVSLFSQFYVVNWLGRFKNVLKDTNQQIQYTRNEETIHALVGIKLVNQIREEHPELFDAELEKKIAYEAKQAFGYESEIIDWMLDGYTDTAEDGDLNPEVLKELVKQRINESLEQIGYKKIFDIDEKIAKRFHWFEEEILGNNMSDFFHAKPVEYAKNNRSYTEEDLF